LLVLRLYIYAKIKTAMSTTSKQKILIVDDEPDILELIEYNLKKEGYQVFLAHNGQEARSYSIRHYDAKNGWHRGLPHYAYHA
jgi:response regulator RpfG family c-di-GMP phosphodiesterase